MAIAYDARILEKEVEKCLKQYRTAKDEEARKIKADLNELLITLENYNDTYILLKLSKEDKALLTEMNLL